MAEEKKRRVGWQLDADAAANDDKGGFSGKYNVTIVECVTDYSKSGAEFVDMRISIADKLDDEGKPKIYSLERMYITNKDNEPIEFSMNRFQTIFQILGVGNDVKKRVAKVWNKVAGEWENKKVDQYYEILGKPIGALVQHQERYRQKPINGYTNEDSSVEDARNNPEVVYIPNYFAEDGSLAEPRSSFSVVRWFDLKTGKTWSEIKGEKPAVIIKDLETKLTMYKEPMLTDDEMDVLKKKLLKKRLQKFNMDFDEEQYIPYGDASETFEDQF